MTKNKIKLLPQVMDFRLNDSGKPEKMIQSKIMTYLKTVPNSNFFKVAQGPWSKGGISDICGCYCGRSIAMEAKTKTGKPTPLQIKFLNNNVLAGGYSAIVRSVEDVKKILEKVKNG
ncbi:MAG: VRR-NUC domain-containing protein [Patescibacteria group bacterium]|nr:VRR-NUC domain-containing protein [Patescibacteria group bacterium]